MNSLPRQTRVPNSALSPPREEWRGSGDYRDGGGSGYQAAPPPGREIYSTGSSRDMPPPMHALPSYQPPPPVVTEQPRTAAKEPTHFKAYKHTYNGTQGKGGLEPPGAGIPVRGLVGAPGFRGGAGEQELYSPAYSVDNPRPESALGRFNICFILV